MLFVKSVITVMNLLNETDILSHILLFNDKSRLEGAHKCLCHTVQTDLCRTCVKIHHFFHVLLATVLKVKVI